MRAANKENRPALRKKHTNRHLEPQEGAAEVSKNGNRSSGVNPEAVLPTRRKKRELDKEAHTLQELKNSIKSKKSSGELKYIQRL